MNHRGLTAQQHHTNTATVVSGLRTTDKGDGLRLSNQSNRNEQSPYPGSHPVLTGEQQWMMHLRSLGQESSSQHPERMQVDGGSTYLDQQLPQQGSNFRRSDSLERMNLMERQKLMISSGMPQLQEQPKVMHSIGKSSQEQQLNLLNASGRLTQEQQLNLLNASGRLTQEQQLNMLSSRGRLTQEQQLNMLNSSGRSSQEQQLNLLRKSSGRSSQEQLTYMQGGSVGFTQEQILMLRQASGIATIEEIKRMYPSVCVSQKQMCSYEGMPLEQQKIMQGNGSSSSIEHQKAVMIYQQQMYQMKMKAETAGSNPRRQMHAETTAMEKSLAARQEMWSRQMGRQRTQSRDNNVQASMMDNRISTSPYINPTSPSMGSLMSSTDSKHSASYPMRDHRPTDASMYDTRSQIGRDIPSSFVPGNGVPSATSLYRNPFPTGGNISSTMDNRIPTSRCTQPASEFISRPPAHPDVRKEHPRSVARGSLTGSQYQPSPLYPPDSRTDYVPVQPHQSGKQLPNGLGIDSRVYSVDMQNEADRRLYSLQGARMNGNMPCTTRPVASDTGTASSYWGQSHSNNETFMNSGVYFKPTFVNGLPG